MLHPASPTAVTVAELAAPYRDHRGVMYTDYGLVVRTETGVRCGNCHERHANVVSVLACHEEAWAAEQAGYDDWLAEQRYERALEDRGYWDARAQEDHEAAMGVVPFHVAYAEAMAEAA